MKKFLKIRNILMLIVAPMVFIPLIFALLNPTPSEDDRRITYRIGKGAQILELQLIDHIIIGDNQYYSFKEQEQLI